MVTNHSLSLSVTADSAAYLKIKAYASWPLIQIPSPSPRPHPSISPATRSSMHLITTEVIHHVIYIKFTASMPCPSCTVINFCSCFDCQPCLWEAGCEHPAHARRGQWNSSGGNTDLFGASVKLWLFCSRSWYVVATVLGWSLILPLEVIPYIILPRYCIWQWAWVHAATEARGALRQYLVHV